MWDQAGCGHALQVCERQVRKLLPLFCNHHLSLLTQGSDILSILEECEAAGREDLGHEATLNLLWHYDITMINWVWHHQGDGVLSDSLFSELGI